MKLKGKIVSKKIGAGSKSEHQAVCFQTVRGEFVLQELGANPFQNDGLSRLVGQELTLNGTIKGARFVLPVGSVQAIK